MNLTKCNSPSNLLDTELWTPTPLLPAKVIGDKLRIDLWFKREDCTPVGSFKLRGAIVAMHRLKAEILSNSIWVASAGNFGLAVAQAGGRYGINISVVVPNGATPSKIDRIQLTGAHIVTYGNDFDESKEHARQKALETGSTFWEDGSIPEIAEGASTISHEILSQSDSWDWVIVPIGNGSLIKGIADVFKQNSPATKIVGIVPSGAPSMYHAIKGNSNFDGSPISTVADGLAVRMPIQPIVNELTPLLDDLWLVSESEILPAINTLMKYESILVEPSAAIGLAGIVAHQNLLEGEKVAMIITGAHLDHKLLPQIIGSSPLV
ncbi:MAG: pyridoxal-phosphate dependent enzyme [Chloroflexota bacterium]|nr:pyridoxal-phosphate dependent enzyme [Chloroflexota bacterium]